jgi:hypothetical protein
MGAKEGHEWNWKTICEEGDVVEEQRARES